MQIAQSDRAPPEHKQGAVNRVRQRPRHHQLALLRKLVRRRQVCFPEWAPLLYNVCTYKDAATVVGVGRKLGARL
jgi:hypothetical protein